MVANAIPELPCFRLGPDVTIEELKQRVFPNGTDKRMGKQECAQFVDKIISESFDNWRTVVYDRW